MGERVVIEGVVLAVVQVLSGVPNRNRHSVPSVRLFAPQKQQNTKSGQFIHRGGQSLCPGGKFFQFPQTNSKARYTSDHGAPRCVQKLSGEADSTAMLNGQPVEVDTAAQVVLFSLV